MPTVMVIDGLRVVIYPNDHEPAHVHVMGDGCEARFALQGVEGEVELIENYGFRSRVIVASRRRWRADRLLWWRGGRKSMTKCDEMKRAQTAARDRQADFPRVTAAYYSPEMERLVIELSSGLGLLLTAGDLQGLERASPDDLRSVEISPSGFGLHFPAVDADIYVPALIEGRLGSAAYMAARLGAAGGRARSPGKASAARENGRLGGRPRKVAAG